MDNKQKPVLTELLSTSRQLAETASAGDWEAVATLRVRHEELVRTFFSHINGAPLSAHVMSELAQVRVYTDMVLELAKRRRASLVEAGQVLQSRQRATTAYAETASP
ncbi:MAG: hypothetical protein AAF610_04945 [Pseudomonadota bacterium]